MADVLARIIERKRREVAERLPAPLAAVPTRRSLRQALARPGARFIMEVKQRSPSGHMARHDLDMAVRAYAPVADAISVLTDGGDFGGSLDDLRRVRAAFDGPILAKDFIVDPAQVSEARAAGADAVLVMMSVLDDEVAAAVMDAARGLAMDAIVEVHDEEELARALALGATIVGINNRDLKTLKTDLAVTERLAPRVPAGVLVIAESGIATRTDVLRLASLTDAFLVGSSLMAADDIAFAARSLVFGPTKICGLTRVEDVASAAASGATHAGFVFVPGTPRAVTVAAARPLAATAREPGLCPVGVFRDAAPDDIVDAVDSLGLGAVQLHGKEDDAMIVGLRERLPASVEIIAAVDGNRPVVRQGADRLIIDNGAGGSGKAFDWSTIDAFPAKDSAFVAGGIGPHTAAAASRLGTFGIDVGSGVEAAPGIKDPDRIKSLFDALRPVSRGDR